MKISGLLNEGRRILKGCGIETYSLDTRLILAYVLNLPQEKLLSAAEAVVDEGAAEAFFSLIHKRTAFMPIQYITNTCEFYSLKFYVDKNVLIPRPDTETLVDLAIKNIGDKPCKIIEVGSGSGAVAVSIAKHCKNASVVSVDISQNALKIARNNAASNNAPVTFRLSDIYDGLLPGDYPADYILSNPPYIESGHIASLSPSVKDYEPLQALDGGFDGLDFYKKIISKSKPYLKPGGMVLFEIGWNQANPVKLLLKEKNFTNIAVHKDLAGKDRVVSGTL